MPCILFIVLPVMLSVFVAQSGLKDGSAGAKSIRSGYTIPRQINYSFTFQNKTGHPVRNVEFWTYAPVSRTATQLCEHIEASHPYNIIRDDLGNQVLHYTFEEFPPTATKIIRISVNLLIAPSPCPVPLGDGTPFLMCRKYIECDDPGICQVAKRLRAASSKKTAESIYSWASKNMRYTGYCPSDRGALYALKNRAGDCTEYADLFVALCRANKIHSRCIGGYVYQGNAVLKPSNYHNWAEFYHDGSWGIADPQQNIFMSNQSDYITMRIFGCLPDNEALNFHRFKCSDAGIKVIMNG